MDNKLFLFRVKKKICIDCESPDQVHYSGRCLVCHKLSQDSKNIIGEHVTSDKKDSNGYLLSTGGDEYYNKLFLIIFLTILGTVGILKLGGVFDSNFKSEEEIKIDLYSECKSMNGIDCEETFLK